MYRVDNLGKVESFRETREGFLDLNLIFSRVGPLEYQRADGRLETEYLTEEELFNDESLATATGKPVLFMHPPGGCMITKDNVRHYARGSTGTKIIKDTPFATIVATIHDGELINVIKSGRARQVSAGYTTEVVKKHDGKLYQTDRVYNHFSIVPEGRAGDEVRALYGDMFEASPNDDNFLRRTTDALHAASMERHKRSLTLSKESSRLSKKHQSVPRAERLPGHIGPLDHLRRKP